MTTIDLTGRIIVVGAPYMMPGTNRAAQKIILEVSYKDARVKNDLFAIFLYGKDTEVGGPVWNSGAPRGRTVTVRCKLGGKVKDQKDSLMLTLKKIVWH